MLERRQNGRRQWQPERFGVFTHLNPESGPCDLNVSPHHSCLLGPAALLNLLSLHQESTFKIIKMICHLFLWCSIFIKTTWSTSTFILSSLRVVWCLNVLNSSGNKTKYFRLRLTDEVSSERPKTQRELVHKKKLQKSWHMSKKL